MRNHKVFSIFKILKKKVPKWVIKVESSLIFTKGFGVVSEEKLPYERNVNSKAPYCSGNPVTTTNVRPESQLSNFAYKEHNGFKPQISKTTSDGISRKDLEKEGWGDKLSKKKVLERSSVFLDSGRVVEGGKIWPKNQKPKQKTTNSSDSTKGG